MNWRRFILLSGLSAAPVHAGAQGLPPANPFPDQDVLVVVWREGDRCSVLERRTKCSRVASLLQGPLQVSRERPIYVATDGTDEEVRVRASQVMTDIKAAGYRRVLPAGARR
jgi:hypothetical protein